MSSLGQPGTEGHTVLGGSRLGGSGDFGIDRHGPLHYSHPVMVAPPVLLGSAEQQRTKLGRSPARPSRAPTPTSDLGAAAPDGAQPTFRAVQSDNLIACLR